MLTRRAPETLLPRRTAVLSALGVLLGMAPLVVKLGKWESSLLDYDGAAVFVELLVIGPVAVLACVALVRVPRARLQAAGMLVALGTLLCLHLVGALIQLGRDDGVSQLRYGAPIGIAGGLLLVGVGVRVLRSGGRPEGLPSVRAATS